LQESLSSRYDTGQPHPGLAKFHEILTIAYIVPPKILPQGF
jgi:hypothetical protein